MADTGNPTWPSLDRITTAGRSPFDGKVDAIYMTRRQKEREKPEPMEALLPCPHCGQLIIIGVIL